MFRTATTAEMSFGVAETNARVGLTAAGKVAFALLWLFVCSFPVEKTIEIPGLGNISKVLGTLALGAGFLAVVIDGRIRVMSRAHAVLAMFVMWSAVTLRWSLDPDSTTVKALTCAQLLGMAWLIWEFCASESQVTRLMQAYVFGTLYAAVNTLMRYQLARQTYYQRYAADGFDPNDFALTLALSIPMSYALGLRSKGLRAWLYWAQLGLVSLTILLSASRTGFLASCVAASIVPLTFAYTRRRQKLVILTGALAAVLTLMAVVPASSWQRLSTIGSEVQSGSLNDRGLIWRSGLTVYRDHWLAGVGSGAYPRSVEPLLGWPARWLIVAHNTFLSVLVETGIVGFLLFAGFLALLLQAVWRTEGVNRMVWIVTLAVWFIGVNTLTWEIRKPTWLIFALALASARFGAEKLLPRADRVPMPAMEMMGASI
jgi:O-antigen ligase